MQLISQKELPILTGMQYVFFGDNIYHLPTQNCFIEKNATLSIPNVSEKIILLGVPQKNSRVPCLFFVGK